MRTKLGAVLATAAFVVGTVGCVDSGSSVQAVDGDASGAGGTVVPGTPGSTSTVTSDDSSAGGSTTSTTLNGSAVPPTRPPITVDPPGSASSDRDADRAHRTLVGPGVVPGEGWSVVVAPAWPIADLLGGPRCTSAHPDFRLPPAEPTGRDSVSMRSANPGLEFSQVVDLYADADAARHLGALVASPNLELCVGPAIRNSYEPDGYTIESLTVTPYDAGVSAESIGADQVIGFDLTFRLRSSNGVGGETTQRLVMIVIGRAVTELDWLSIVRFDGESRAGASVAALDAIDWVPLIRAAGRGLSIEMAKG